MTSIGEQYSPIIGASKSIKDGIMLAVAAAAAIIGTNAIGIANQCPDATITVLGATVTLKAIMQFLNNYRKNA